MTIPSEWVDRVLSYDDLPEGERAEVREFLATNEDARLLLERVRRAEAGADPVGAIPEEATLSASEMRDADASLAALLRRAGATEAEPTARESLRERWGRAVVAIVRPRVLIPAIAIAAGLFVFLPRRAPEPLVVSLGAFPASASRGGSGREGWNTGDPFVLRCDLRRASALLLVHVDPDGGVDVLLPGTDTERQRMYGPGDTELPGGEEEWVLQGSAGTETFLLAAREGSDATRSVREWIPRVHEVRDAALARDETLAELRRVLRDLGEVRETSIDHRPARSR